MSKIYFVKKGNQYGPYSIDEINEYLTSGELRENDFAWVSGMKDWMPVSDTKFLELGVILPNCAESVSGMEAPNKPLCDDYFSGQKSVHPSRSSPMMELFAPEAIENIKSGMGELGSGAFVIRSIAKYFDFEVEDVAKIVDGFWAYVVDGKNYNWNVRGSLVIPNFGSFFIKKLKARTAINPQTLDKLKIREGYRMSFKMSPSIKWSLRDPFPERSIQSKFTGASWTSKWNGKGLTHLSRKRQIAVVVQQYAGTPLYKTSLVLDSLYDVIICETYKRPLSFFKRGTFTKRAYRAKYGVHPQTGEKIMFKASQKLSFKPTKNLKRNLVNTC